MRTRRFVIRLMVRPACLTMFIAALGILWVTPLVAQGVSPSNGPLSSHRASDAVGVPLDPAIIAIQQAMISAIARGEKSVVAIARGASGSQSRLMMTCRATSDFATGIVVAAEGLILTNQHMVGDPARHDYVVWIDRHPYPATVKAANPYYDLAVLQIDAVGLTPVAFGDTSALKKGQLVLAVGDPWAIARDGSPGASWGIIANLNRLAPPDSTEETQDGKVTLHHFGGLIQTDARLQRGTSGGALLNLDGELIGVTSSLASLEGGQQAAGFAIRIGDRLREVIERLKRGLDVEVGLLGISPEAPLVADREGVPGVRVGRVVLGTGAASSGLLPGDVITHVNRQPVWDHNTLFHQVSQLTAGDTARITALRGTRERTVELDVVLSKKRLTERRVAVATRPLPSWRGLRVEFCSALPAFQQRTSQIDPAGCVAVSEVLPGSPAHQAGLREGYFISHALDRRVGTPADFYAAVAGSPGEVVVRLTTPIDGRDDGRNEVSVRP